MFRYLKLTNTSFNCLRQLATFATKKKPVKSIILFGSETGNAEKVAQTLRDTLKSGGLPKTKLSAMDDYDFEKLAKENKVFAVISTVGEVLYQFFHIIIYNNNFLLILLNK